MQHRAQLLPKLTPPVSDDMARMSHGSLECGAEMHRRLAGGIGSSAPCRPRPSSDVHPVSDRIPGRSLPQSERCTGGKKSHRSPACTRSRTQIFHGSFSTRYSAVLCVRRPRSCPIAQECRSPPARGAERIGRLVHAETPVSVRIRRGVAVAGRSVGRCARCCR